MKTTRRDFLRNAAAGSAAISIGTATPAFWMRAAAAVEEQKKTGENLLVVVQLSGGNDGLNTIVPLDDPEYRRLRPSLAIGTNQTIKIQDGIGFHPSLAGMAKLLENGQVAIVQGVGYPNPNRSHFESMDIWHTCQRKSQRRGDGWLGRYLEVEETSHTGTDAPAMHLGSEKQPLALAARNVRVPSMQSLEAFRLRVADRERALATIDELNRLERKSADNLLDFVQTSTVSALQASRRIEEVQTSEKSAVSFPESALGKKLETVAQLIDAGLGTRIYYVTLGGFDTHARQAAAHAALLRQFSEAVTAFTEEVTQRGHGDRVMLMAFSEFGRRVAENASSGTDHGTAAPLFLVGQRVKAGLIGSHPSLTDLDAGDLKFHTDFRQVYACLLETWLGGDAEAVLGDRFEPIGAVA